MGQGVTARGWVHTIRDMGKITFIDLRDHTGLLQVVVPNSVELPKLGMEYVIEVDGEVRKRGERFINPKLATGEVELGGTAVRVINESAELPFEIKKDTRPVNEELRLKYRYLDLRSERMAENLKLRHRVTKFIRDFLDERDFTEIETPILAKGTPEGSREFLIPSRQHEGQFYVLPQSPQQFKQLLMVGGLGRYYQIARIFRDEDQRADRQPEATQLDLEMSFIEQEDVLVLFETMMRSLVQTLMPQKKLPDGAFPRITYAESMKKYGNDKPDMRRDTSDPDELAFCWVVDFPMFEENTETGKLDAMHHPFTSPKPGDMDKLDTDPLAVRANAYDLVLNGIELSSGSIRIHDSALQKRVFQLLNLQDDEIAAKFGHMIEAFTFGAPPHGGMGFGIDRLVMKLAGEENIREVIAFPKTGDARDPLMGAPSAVDTKALADAHISLTKPKLK